MGAWGKYFLVTSSYGLVSALPQTWKLERTYRHSETLQAKVLPVPIAERVGHVIFKMGLAFSMWPLFVYRDMIRLELYCKGVDPRKYGISPDDTIF
jgi:hypothetical protein